MTIAFTMLNAFSISISLTFIFVSGKEVPFITAIPQTFNFSCFSLVFVCFVFLWFIFLIRLFLYIVSLLGKIDSNFILLFSIVYLLLLLLLKLMFYCNLHCYFLRFLSILRRRASAKRLQSRRSFPGRLFSNH